MKISCIEHPYLRQFTKSFAVETEAGDFLIDTGLHSGIPRIEAAAKEIKGILCTHEHWDHTGGHAYFRDRGAKVYAHAGGEAVLRDVDRQWKLLYGQFEEDCGVPPERREIYFNEVGEPPEIDVLLEDGQELHLGETRVQVIAVPGHSDGSVAFYLPESGDIFTGDVVCGAGFFRALPQINHINSYKETLEKLRKMDVEREYSAHAPGVRSRKEFQQLLKDGLDCMERMSVWTKQYLDAHPGGAALKELADHICRKETDKVSGSGAYITSAAYLEMYADQYETAALCCEKYIL